MVAMEVTVSDEDESAFKIVTKMTTSNIQIDTGVMILISSSPRDSRMVVGLGFWAIVYSKIGSISVLGGAPIDGYFEICPAL